MTAFPLSWLAECCCFDLPHGTAALERVADWALLLSVLLSVLVALLHGALALEVGKVPRLCKVLVLELRQRLVLWVLLQDGRVLATLQDRLELLLGLVLPTLQDGLELLLGLVLPTLQDGLELLLGLVLPTLRDGLELLIGQVLLRLGQALPTVQEGLELLLWRLPLPLWAARLLQSVAGSLHRAVWLELLHLLHQEQLLLGSLLVHHPWPS